MNGGFSVDLAGLDVHAQEVDKLAERMRLAAAAGRPLGLAAYGVVGQIFALAAMDATDIGSASVGRVATTAQQIGDGVRATRDAYRDVEDSAAATFRGLR